MRSRASTRDNVFNAISSDHTTQLAGFVGLTYTPLTALEIGVGGRESRLTDTSSGTSNGVFGTGPTSTGVSENAFTPRFSAKYRFDPQDHWCTSRRRRGFRAGGANGALGSACGGFGYSVNQQIPYGSDSLWSYELGIKTSLFDDRVAISADAFHIDWRHIQQKETLSNGADGCFAALDAEPRHRAKRRRRDRSHRQAHGGPGAARGRRLRGCAAHQGGVRHRVHRRRTVEQRAEVLRCPRPRTIPSRRRGGGVSPGHDTATPAAARATPRMRRDWSARPTN